MNDNTDGRIINNGKRLTATALSFCIVLFIARIPLEGKLWDIRFDILLGRDSFGLIALGYAVSLTACVGCVYCLAKERGLRRIVWIVLFPIAVLPILGIQRSPSVKDVPGVAARGAILVNAIEAYKQRRRTYPSELDRLVPEFLSQLPKSGIGRNRPFYYARRDGVDVQEGPCFNGANQFLGHDPYALAVPFVPGGTLVYRPSGDYSDLPGQPGAQGWFLSSVD